MLTYVRISWEDIKQATVGVLVAAFYWTRDVTGRTTVWVWHLKLGGYTSQNSIDLGSQPNRILCYRQKWIAENKNWRHYIKCRRKNSPRIMVNFKLTCNESHGDRNIHPMMKFTWLYLARCDIYRLDVRSTICKTIHKGVKPNWYTCTCKLKKKGGGLISECQRIRTFIHLYS